MVIVLFEPKIPETNDAFCSASEANKQNPRDRTLDLPSFIRCEHITSLMNHILFAQGESLPYWFRATFAVVFVMIFRLRELLRLQS